MRDTGEKFDKGEERATSPVKPRDFTRPQNQDRLELNPQREFLRGGMERASSSKQQGETTRQKIAAIKQRIQEYNTTLVMMELNDSNLTNIREIYESRIKDSGPLDFKLRNEIYEKYPDEKTQKYLKTLCDRSMAQGTIDAHTRLDEYYKRNQ